MVQVGALGTLMSRALPLLMLIVVVYFTGELWQPAARMTRQPPCAGTWFSVHIPIPETVVHTSLFVAVLSGLYFTVSTSVDPLYRQRFFDPLVSDVAVSLAGRDAYLDMETRRVTPDPVP
jgi:hypothetical protein